MKRPSHIVYILVYLLFCLGHAEAKDTLITRLTWKRAIQNGLNPSNPSYNKIQNWPEKYVKANHLSNVMVVVSGLTKGVDLGTDGKADYYTANVVDAGFYYPFGAPLPGRKYTLANYKYGFQGQERDDETGTYAFDYRIHDPRLGRFLSIDPLTSKFPHNSPYAFAENRVIDGLELEGLEIYLLNSNTEKDIIEGFKKGEEGDEYDSDAIHIYAHGNQEHIMDGSGKKAVFMTPNQFGKFLKTKDERFKNKRDGKETVIILHSCRTGRMTTDKMTKEVIQSFAQKLSKQYDVTVIAPDERDYVGKGGEAGPKVTDKTDENGELLTDKDGKRLNPKKTSTGELGNWNVYKNGKLVEQYDGSWIPKTNPTFFDKLFKRNGKIDTKVKK